MSFSTQAIEEAIGIAETEGQTKCVVEATAELAALLGTTPAWALRNALRGVENALCALSDDSQLSPQMLLAYNMLQQIEIALQPEVKSAELREAAADAKESEGL